MKPGRALPPARRSTPLGREITVCIDRYHAENHVSVVELLEALEVIRYNVTEAWIAANKGVMPKLR